PGPAVYSFRFAEPAREVVQTAQIDACLDVMGVDLEAGFIGGPRSVRIRIFEGKGPCVVLIGGVMGSWECRLPGDDVQPTPGLADIEREDVLPGLGFPQHFALA